MEIRIRKITPLEAETAEKYIRQECVKPKFMTKAEMSETTGLPESKCSRVLNTLEKAGLLQMQYAIYCPECRNLVHRQPYVRGIKRSGYMCPWCGGSVTYKKENIGRLYAPQDCQKTTLLGTTALISEAY